MATNFAEIIEDYRARCEQLLKDSVLGSLEHRAYSEILQVFNQNQTGEPGDQALAISLALGGKAVGMQPVYGAPAEARTMVAKARAIVEEWTRDFRRDTGLSEIGYHYRLVR